METESTEDAWHDRLIKAVYDFGVVLTELHGSNPWPEYAVLDSALSQLATEFWDHCFSQAEIRRAYEGALSDLTSYAAGEERRP